MSFKEREPILDALYDTHGSVLLAFVHIRPCRLSTFKDSLDDLPQPVETTLFDFKRETFCCHRLNKISCLSSRVESLLHNMTNHTLCW